MFKTHREAQVRGRTDLNSWRHIIPSEVCHCHEPRIVERRCLDKASSVGGIMGIHLFTNRAGPITMVADFLKLLLFDETVPHVAEHSDGTRTDGSC